MKTIEELNKKYNLELNKIVETIESKKPKTILLQLPDGLKPYATILIDFIEEQTEHKYIRIALSSCFGACDLPNTQADLIIQLGHAPWRTKRSEQEETF